MAEPLGAAQMSHLPVLSCICSLQAAGFTEVWMDVVKGGCGRDLLWLAGGSKILESRQQVML